MDTTLARVSARRLARSPRALLPVAGWIAVLIVSALLLRGRATAPADHLMRGAFGFLVLPFVVFAIVRAQLGVSGLRTHVRGISLLGARPKDVAVAAVAVAVAVSAATGGGLAIVGCALAHGPSDVSLVRDLPASFVVGLLGGAAYGALFAAGSAVARGAFAGVLLGLDFVLGTLHGLPAAVLPRAHVLALLGGAPFPDLSPRASSVALVAMTVAWSAIAVRLARRG